MTELQEQGTFGVTLLILLIVLSIFLVIIAMVTCYLYNVCNCYEKLRRCRKTRETLTQSDYETVESDEIESRMNNEMFASVRYNKKRHNQEIAKTKTSPKLPILRISDIEKRHGKRKPRPDSTVILGQGRLTFALKYVEENEMLHVHLINGRQITLPSGELARLPIVKLRVNEEADTEKQSSPDDTPNPEFDEVLSFRLKEDSLGCAMLNFTIWDSDLNMFKALVGFISLPLANFLDSLFRPGGTGPVTREINLNPLTDIPPRSNGEILISLSYTAEQDKLIVAVMKCRDVITDDDVTGLYVTVSLCANGKEISKKSTQPIEQYRNLIFNEMVSFEPSMKQANLTKDNISINLSVKSRTLADEDIIVGEASIGPNTTEEGILHWNEMATNPRTAVAQWHRLTF